MTKEVWMIQVLSDEQRVEIAKKVHKFWRTWSRSKTLHVPWERLDETKKNGHVLRLLTLYRRS